MNPSQIGEPRAAVTQRARTAAATGHDGEAAFWTAIYHLAGGAPLYDRADQAVAALAGVVKP